MSLEPEDVCFSRWEKQVVQTCSLFELLLQHRLVLKLDVEMEALMCPIAKETGMTLVLNGDGTVNSNQSICKLFSKNSSLGTAYFGLRKPFLNHFARG